jgi:spermidine dehydrogenase
MKDRHDRELGMDRPITRRDFLNGIAVCGGGAVAGSWLAGCGRAETRPLGQDAAGYNPSAVTGMRGGHVGSFETAHQVRDGTFWQKAGSASNTGEVYDLVVVGAGISGLAAAYYFRQKAGQNARILILDNHDDFGGHAQRNEFNVGGRLLITNAGTYGIESPFPYSKEARGLMDELGIDPPALAAKCEDHEALRGLQAAYFFDKETFGEDRLVVGAPARWRRGETEVSWKEFLAKTPLSAKVQQEITRLEEDKVDYMPGLSSDEKKDRLSRMSYRDFLLNYVKLHHDALPFYQTRTHSLYAAGIDAVAALDCWALGYPGFQGMNIERSLPAPLSYTALGYLTPHEPYSFRHPDGGASVARHLVRALIPAAVSGHTAEDIVTAKVDYGRLDVSGSPLRIRLNSTVVRARNVGEPESAKEVEVAYERHGQVFSVRGKGVVLACWNSMIPYICPELPKHQKEALVYGVKSPLVYTRVAIRNWTSFKKIGISAVSSPGMYHTGVSLDPAINIGDYKYPSSPEEPMVLSLMRTPCQPGLPLRDQYRVGHVELYDTPFETFERKIRDQLARILAPGGFDPARDIAGIAVNRWPHGYACEYDLLGDPDWPEDQKPCVIGRKQFGRITIANSDAAAAAYMDPAMDQAYRAVGELLAT